MSPCPFCNPLTDLSLKFILPGMIFPGETAQKSESENGETAQKMKMTSLQRCLRKARMMFKRTTAQNPKLRHSESKKPRSSKANPLASVIEAQRDARLELEKLRNATFDKQFEVKQITEAQRADIEPKKS